MRITLYVATSVDGYIAKLNKDSEWVSPVCGESFNQTIQEYGCIILGSHTYDQYHEEMYPVKGVLNIVVSSDAKRQSDNPELVFAHTPHAAIEIAKINGHDKALLIGGGTINASFLKENLIDDLIIDIHPLILGKGIKVFENIETETALTRNSVVSMEDDLVQMRFSVNK